MLVHERRFGERRKQDLLSRQAMDHHGCVARYQHRVDVVPRHEQARTPNAVREVALAIIAAALPFQAIYFLIYTFLLEHEARLPPERIHKLDLASALCQVVSYGSLVGVAMMWYHLSPWIGFSFIASSILAIFLIRNVMAPVEPKIDDGSETAQPPA